MPPNLDDMKKTAGIPDEIVMKKIFLIRGQKVMLDFHLAELYDVETKQLKRSVRRNLLRFPVDFMFALTRKELKNLRCQFGTSSWGGVRYIPMVFTEQGVAMLSSILNSDRAVLVNIGIIRVFTRIRAMVLTNKDVLLKLERMEKSLVRHDDEIKQVFGYLRKLLSPQTKAMRKIGFQQRRPL